MLIYPQILFVTNREDFAIDYLIYNFKNKGVPYLRLNSEDISEISICHNISTTILQIKNITFDLSKVKSVYFRRAPTVFHKSFENADVQFVNRERRDFLEGLYISLGAKWINPIFSTYMSERKIFQLNLAKSIGFTTPKSLASNNPEKIISFMETNKRNIIKPISHGLQITNEGAYSIHTSEITRKNLCEKKHTIIECPVLIQERVANCCDIRATVVGKKIFAVEIHKENKEEVDWRKPGEKISYKDHSLPKSIEQLIFKLHKSLSLTYSGIDFIYTPAQQYYFLEINPAGEWVWLDNELKIPIANQLITELLGE